MTVIVEKILPQQKLRKKPLVKILINMSICLLYTSNITGADKQELLLETLRVLKKGGTFAIHDLMSKARYGDMEYLPIFQSATEYRTLKDL